MIRTVFDTVVFVRSLLNPRSIWGQLVFQHFERYRLFVSQPIVLEILEVLQRPELSSRFRSLPDRDLRQMLAILAEAEVVELTTIPSVSRDPKDDKFLATADEARAEYLVSEDNDLLVIGEYQGVRIINTAEFLRILATSTT